MTKKIEKTTPVKLTNEEIAYIIANAPKDEMLTTIVRRNLPAVTAVAKDIQGRPGVSEMVNKTIDDIQKVKSFDQRTTEIIDLAQSYGSGINRSFDELFGRKPVKTVRKTTKKTVARRSSLPF